MLCYTPLLPSGENCLDFLHKENLPLPTDHEVSAILYTDGVWCFGERNVADDVW